MRRDMANHDLYAKLLGALVDAGWQVTSEGPSGAQLAKPKEMKLQTKVALVIGAVLVMAWGLGLIIMFFALIDYWMTKPATHFLSTSAPSLPEGTQKLKGFRIV